MPAREPKIVLSGGLAEKDVFIVVIVDVVDDSSETGLAEVGGVYQAGGPVVLTS